MMEEIEFTAQDEYYQNEEDIQRRQTKKRSAPGNKKNTSNTNKRRRNDGAETNREVGDTQMPIITFDNGSDLSDSEIEEMRIDVKRTIDNMVEYWTMPSDITSPTDKLKWICDAYELDAEMTSIQQIERKYCEFVATYFNLYKDAFKCRLISDGYSALMKENVDSQYDEYMFKMSFIKDIFSNGREALKATLMADRRVYEREVPDKNPFDRVYKSIVDTDEKPINRMGKEEIIYAWTKRIMTDSDHAIDVFGFVHEPIYNSREEKTMAYKPLKVVLNDVEKKIVIKDYIYMRSSEIQPQVYPEVYDAFSKSRNRVIKEVAESISNVYAAKVKILNSSKRIFSFNNGAYISMANPFVKEEYKFGDEKFHRTMTDAFIPYNDYGNIFIGKSPTLIKTTLRPLLIKKFTSVNHFEKQDVDVSVFDNYIEDWRDIQTPWFDSLFEYQGIPREAIEIFYVFWARLLYFMNDADDFQLLLFIKGPAGCGKSLLIKLLIYTLGMANVGTISESMEKSFGLGYINRKHVVVVPEVGSRFPVTQNDTQAMVSGDPMYLNTKFDDPDMDAWRSHLLVVGNKNFPFIDTQGNIDRRILYFLFKKAYIGKEGENEENMFNKLKNEIPNIIMKANRAYMDFVKKWGNRSNILNTNILPKYFEEARNECYEEVSPMFKFMTKYFGKRIFVKQEGCETDLERVKELFKEYKEDEKIRTRYTDTDFVWMFAVKYRLAHREQKEPFEATYIVDLDIQSGMGHQSTNQEIVPVVPLEG